MAARRKSPPKKKRARRGSRGAPTLKKKAKKRVVIARAPKKKRAAKPKKRVGSRRQSKKNVVSKRLVLKPKKKHVGSKHPVRKSKKRKQSPSPAQRAAITRTLRAFTSLSKPREYTREAVKIIYNTRRKALVDALTRAGFSPASIRARLSWITRRRSTLRDEIARIRMEVLGTRLLHGSDPDQRRILETMIRERDYRYLEFIEQTKEMDLSQTELINEWFSPKVQSA